MKLWLDDERMPELDWNWVTSAGSAIDELKTGRVKIISLDHDLGSGCKTGYDVINWIEKQVMTTEFNPPTIYLHTQSPVGMDKMKVVRHRIHKTMQKRRGIGA